jgi:hypothetical protein
MHWTWNYPWEPEVTWGIIAIVAVLILGSYLLVRRELGRLSLASMGILLFRCAAFALLIFLLLQPSVFMTRTDKIPPNVAILLDTSKSMGVTDEGKKVNRLQEAIYLLKGSELVRKLQKDSRLSTYAFTTGLSPLALHRLDPNLAAEGTGTSLGLSLSQVKDEFRGEDLAGVILLTDGRDNAGTDPVAAASELRAPIYSIGLGASKKAEEKEKEKDLAVVNVQHDQRVIVGHATDITVTVTSRGYEPRSVPVELTMDDRVITRSAVALSPDRPERQIVLKLTPDEPGQYVYVVRVPVEPDETNKGNNEKAVPLYVTDPVARVLYVEARPRWEFKFLSRVLNGYKNIQHTSIVRMGAEKTIVQGSDPAESAMIASMAPSQILRLKAMIIGDVPRSFFNDEQISAIVTFVEQGGSILLLAGRKNLGPEGFGETPLAKVLPVELAGEPGYFEKPFNITLTDDGKAHPAFQSVNYEWSNAPPLISLLRAGQLRPGATTLMKTADELALPVVVVHRYGKGKAGTLLTDSSWRWKLGMTDGSVAFDLHTVFWRQLITWLMPDQKIEKEKRAVQLIADKLKYELNETVQLTVSALDAEGALAKQATVECRIFTPDGKAVKAAAVFAKLSESGDVQAEGFLATFVTHVTGKYKVVATATNQGVNLGRDEVSFVVGDVSVEMENTDPDHGLLKRFASVSRGKFYDASEFAKLAADISIEAKKNTWTEKRQIWNEWWVFWCFVGLVSAEWIIRKWRQLE